MFWDHVLLNPQHRGSLGLAWIAGTRGIKSVPGKEIKRIDLLNLCAYLRDFIISESSSPKKRFSLRLSAILLNGTIKIFREKTVIFQAEVINILQIVRIPAGHRELQLREALECTPETPQEKVRTKRKKKPAKITQSTESPKVYEEGPIQVVTTRLEEFRDILPPEEITLREPVIVASPKQQELEPMIIITEADLPKRRRKLTVSESQSSEGPVPEKIVVSAQIHHPKGTYLDDEQLGVRARDEQLEVRALDEHLVQRAQPEIPYALEHVELPSLQAEPVPAPVPEAMEIVEEPIVQVDVGRVDIAVPPEIPVAEIPVVQEEPAVKPSERESIPTTKAKRAPLRQKSSSTSAPETVPITRAPPVKDKIICVRRHRLTVRIGRCLPDENKFVYEHRPLPSKFRDIQNVNLYNFFCTDEEDVTMIQGRAGSSIRTPSQRDSLRLGRSKSASRSTLPEKEVTPKMTMDIVPTTPVLEEVSRKKSSVLPSMRETDMVLPIIEEDAGEKARKVTSMEVQPIELREEIPVQAQLQEEIIPSKKTLDVIPPTYEETTLIPPVETTEQIPRERLERTVETVQPPPAYMGKPREKEHILHSAQVDFKKRQQDIVDILIRWNFTRGPLTMIDICPKPINKLNMARTFGDVLALCSKKYLKLIPYEDSIELKFIEKGPKLLE